MSSFWTMEMIRAFGQRSSAARIASGAPSSFGPLEETVISA